MSVVELNSDNFQTQTENGKSVIDFFATWCGPCKMMAPVLEEVSEEHKDISFYKVDVDQAMDIATKYGIMSVPTLIVMQDGEVIQKSIGAIPKSELEDLIS